MLKPCVSHVCVLILQTGWPHRNEETYIVLCNVLHKNVKIYDYNTCMVNMLLHLFCTIIPHISLYLNQKRTCWNNLKIKIQINVQILCKFWCLSHKLNINIIFIVVMSVQSYWSVIMMQYDFILVGPNYTESSKLLIPSYFPIYLSNIIKCYECIMYDHTITRLVCNICTLGHKASFTKYILSLNADLYFNGKHVSQ